MTDILAGATIKANDRPATAYSTDGTSITNIVSTTFITGTPTVATTFTAPTSGRVLLVVTMGFRDNGGTDRVIAAPNVFLGTDATGTEVLSTASTLETECTSAPEATAFYYVSRTSLLEGLTGGSTYYARLLYKVASGAGTADISRRELLVVPTP